MEESWIIFIKKQKRVIQNGYAKTVIKVMMQLRFWKNLIIENRSANLILTDPETRREGITLAAILLFGKDNSIMSVLPQHKTDAIFRVENKDRYDDRDVVITNLIDSYDRLIEFGQKHLNDIFVLVGIVNVNARDRILREIGLADELGSGMRNTYKYTQLYSGQNPLFEEGDIFRTIIPLKKIATQKVGGGNVSRMSLEEIENIIKGMIKEDNKVSRKDIAMILGVSEKTITRYIKEIPNIKYVGKGKNGHWELND